MKKIFVVFVYVVISTLLFARGEMGGLSYGMVKMLYDQDGKFIMKLPGGGKFDFSKIAHLPIEQQEIEWNKIEKKLYASLKHKKVKDPMAKAKRMIERESKLLKAGTDQVSGKKPYTKKYSEYIRTDKEIKSYIKEITKKQLKRQKKACKRGDANECFNLGKLYFAGVGIPQSIKKAKYYLTRTCSLGMGIGCFYVGKQLVISKKERMKQYKKSCQKGYDSGCTEVGSMYLHGRGTKQDFKKAFQYLNQACTRNNSDGCHLMASIYSFGLGKEKSKSLTKKYLRKANDIRKRPWKYK